MEGFSIKLSEVEKLIEVLSHYAVQLNEIKQEVLSAKNNLKIMGSASYGIYSTLSGIDRAILEKALEMKSLSAALEKISSYYRNTEKNIVSSGSEDNINKSETADVKQNELVSFIRKAFLDLLAALAIVGVRPVRVPGEEITEFQQNQMDLYMRNKIKKIFNKEEFSEKTWKMASKEERERILNEYFREVAAVMGIEIGDIEYLSTEGKDNYYLMGSYSDTLKKIIINSYILEGKDENAPDSYLLFSTVTHELRHAYQHAACENPEKFIVTEETIQSWQDSFDNYKSKDDFMSDGLDKEAAYQAYRDQAVEKDARWFSGEN